MDLIERQKPLDQLLQYRDEAARGEGRLVLLAGEAGLGKTALVGALVRVASEGGTRVLVGACDALSTPRPLGPLLDIAASTRGELARLLQQGAPADEIFAALLADLATGRAATLVVIEDAHWADAATLDLLRFLARRLAAVRTILVVTYRDDEVGPRHPLRTVLGDLATSATVRRLALAPLSEAGVRVLSRGTAFDAATLHRRTRGNPFFVVEALAAGSTSLPESVRDAVLARASRLDDAARGTLEAAAVLGPRIDPARLAEIVEGPLDVDGCLGAGMLEADGASLAFRHELARDAILSVLSPAARRSLHVRALAVLRARSHRAEDLAMLAHHAEGAGDAAAVCEYARSAARHAASLRAHREAAAQYARARRFSDDLPVSEVAELLEAHAYECYLTDQGTEAIAALQTATALREQLGEPLRRGENLRWLSRISWFTGAFDPANRFAKEALAVLEPLGPSRELAAAYSNQSQLCMNQSESKAAIAWGRKALVLARRFDDPLIEAHACNNIGSALAGATKGTRGWDELEESLAISRRHKLEEHVARALTNLASYAIAARQLDRGARSLEEGLAYCADHGLDAWMFYMQGWRATMFLRMGRLDAAVEQAAATLGHPSLSAISKVGPLCILGLVRALRGDPEAWEPLDEALSIAGQTRELQRLAPVSVARAATAWLGGDDARAVEEALATLPMALARDDVWYAGELATWVRRAGGDAKAKVAAAEPYCLQLAGKWRRAASSWRARGCELDAAYAELDGGVEESLRQALAAFDRMGARAMTTRITRKLRELGVRAVPRGPRQSTRENPAGLTDRELGVLRELAAGLKNADIGRRLHISAKTVDHHISSILTKLAAKNRTEAVHKAAAIGIALPK